MSRLLLALLLMAPTTMFAQRGPEPKGEPTGAELEVHNTYKAFTEAWNKHDASAMATMWTDDGDHMEPDGRTVFGKKEVQRLLAYEHASVFKSSKLHLAIEHVRLPKKGVAVADGTYELFGVTDTRGNKIPIRAGYFTSFLIKDGDKWKVTSSRLMLPQALIWRERD